MQHAYEQITIGDPLDSHNLMGPLIDQHAVEQFKIAVMSIKEAGGQIVFGGDVLNNLVLLFNLL